ncbi:MAG: DUF599 domain-containing protein [Hyphomicrobiaceae bacterium]
MLSLDMIAFLTFAALFGGYHHVSGYRSLVNRSIVGAVQTQRVAWMRNMALRDVRIVDAQLLASLSQGNAFFASTSAIGIGGLAAMIGSGDKVQGLFERLPYAAQATVVVWELKLVLLITIFIYAFFKFAWAFRLSHYTAIMIGATPIADGSNRVECDSHALRTAQLVGIAAEHSNGGLRAFYFAIAALAWFYHPVAFLAATLWVLAILVRRDFFSRSRRLILGPNAKGAG